MTGETPLPRIEIEVIGSESDVEAYRRVRADEGAIDVHNSALLVALRFSREEKNKALDDQDFEQAAEWRAIEKDVILALGGLGLMPAIDI